METMLYEQLRKIFPHMEDLRLLEDGKTVEGMHRGGNAWIAIAVLGEAQGSSGNSYTNVRELEPIDSLGHHLLSE